MRKFSPARFLALCGLTACVGSVGDVPGGGAPGGSAAPASPSPGTHMAGSPPVLGGPRSSDGTAGGACGYLPARIYRLTPAQVRRSMVALLGTAAAGDDLQALLQGSVPDGQPFSNGETILAASPGFIETIYGGARDAAAKATATPAVLSPCFASGVTRACVQSFLADFGARAWRRPWTDEETASYLAFFDTITGKSDAKRGLEYVLRRILSAPDFLFRFELGGAPDKNGVAALTPDELASALAYTLTDAPPDAALGAAARQHGLDTADGVATQARRLLEKPDAAAGVFGFFDDLLDGKQTGHPDQPIELRRLVQNVLWSDGGKLSTLLTAPYTFVNAALQKFYGWTKLPAITDFTQVTPPAPEQRAGVLTTGLFLSRNTNRSARGKFIKALLMCSQVPDPPPDVVQNLENQRTTLSAQLGRPATAEEARDAHMNNPACNSCHKLIDPIGKPLLAFDRTGLFQATDPDTKKPFDTAADIQATGEIDGPIAGPRALAQKLAGARSVSDCMARQVYQYALGRAAGDADRCAIDALAERLRTSGGDVRQLFADVVASDIFRLRRK